MSTVDANRSRARRGIAAVALGVMMCFLLLSYFDSQFILVHFYESLIYLAITVVLFYGENRWAYMLGMVTPIVWLALFFVLTRVQRPDFPASLLGVVILILSVLMVVSCGARWRLEFAGLGRGWSTFLVCLGVVLIYYGALILWILRWWTPTVA